MDKVEFIVETISDCKFSSADKSRVDCMVKFAHLPEPVPFTADANDSEVHGREIFAKAIEEQSIAGFVEPPPFVRQKTTTELRIDKLETALVAANIPL